MKEAGGLSAFEDKLGDIYPFHVMIVLIFYLDSEQKK